MHIGYDEHHLVVDCSNLLYRAYYANQNEPSEDSAGLAMHMAFATIFKFYNRLRPSTVVLCFDRPNWRKQYTLSDECYSKKVYKGGRRKDQTAAQEAKYQAFLLHIAEFETLIREHTRIVCMGAPELEGDDCISAWVQAHPDAFHSVISADRDFVYLLSLGNMELIDPDSEKPRVCDDPHYFLLMKQFRGEPATGDNIQNACPKLRETEIEKAYNDPYVMANIRAKEWKHPVTGDMMSVGRLLDENKLLMDLIDGQPERIKKLMFKTVLDAKRNRGSFSHFHILRFLGKHQLKRLSETIERYVPMLAQK